MKPEYKTLSIKYPNHDLDVLFNTKRDFLKKYYIKISEDNCNVIQADGKYGLLYEGKIVPDLIFDKITKLSYRHYLCQNQELYTIYRFNDIGYNRLRENKPLVNMLSIPFKGNLTLENLLTKLFESWPDVYSDISNLIEPYSQNQYLSRFNHFSAFVDDIHFNWAVLRVIIGNDYRTNDFDIKYGRLVSD